MCYRVPLLVLTCYSLAAWVSAFDINLVSNSPVLLGETLVLNVSITESGAPRPAKYCFTWRFRNLTLSLTDVEASTGNVWEIPTYDGGPFHVGQFGATVEVAEPVFSFCPFAHKEKTFVDLTDTVSGELTIEQQNKTVTEFALKGVPTNHTLAVNGHQWEYLKERATSVQITWIIDCVQVAVGQNLSIMHTYPKDADSLNVFAFIDANFIPPTTTTTTTTTTTPKPTTTTTTSTTTSTTTTTTTTEKPHQETTTASPITSTATPLASGNSTTTAKAKLVKRAAPAEGSTTASPSVADGFQTNCTTNLLQREPGHVYGYFKRVVSIKTPITNVTTEGSNWVNKGDQLKMRFKCSGSPPFRYCIDYRAGIYNVTGRETCTFYLTTDTCDIPALRYLFADTQYTIVVIISNAISKVVKPTVVKIIVDPGNQGQLSVILVPVAFILLSITGVIYGVAYYLQNRRMAIVEVADFNFGDSGSVEDMEYKSFSQRLVDSVHDVVNEMRQNRSGVPTDLTGGDSTVGYGSMK